MANQPSSVAVAVAADSEAAAIVEEPEQKSAMGAFMVRLAGGMDFGSVEQYRSETLI